MLRGRAGLRSRPALSAGDCAAAGTGTRADGGLVAVAVVLTLVLCLAFGASTASAAAPTFTVDPTPTASYTTAQVSGTIDPGENEVFYVFQYAAHPETEGWAAGPLIFTQTLAASSGSNSVSEELTGLKPGTKYQLRLWALITDFSQEWTSPEPYVTFETEAVAAPTATLEPIATHTSTTAHFSGTVNPNAPAGALSEAAKAAYTTEWHFECTPECPGLTGGTIEAEEGSQPVSVNATGLEPNTAYEVRLVASNADGPSTATESFSTDLILPDVKTEAGGSDDKGGYILQGIVNAHNSEIISCHFEYGPTTAYGKEAACAPMPGTGNKPVEVTAHLSGLTLDATYHFQLVATNGAGPESSGDATFLATAPSSEACANEGIRVENHSLALPECRAYELASTAFTAGYSVTLFGVAEDNTVSYATYAGNVAGSGSGASQNHYVTTRTNTGWETLANLNGPSGTIQSGPEGFYLCGCLSSFEYSADLRSSVWYMAKSGESGYINDIYLREPDGSFTLVAPGLGHELGATAPGHIQPGSPATSIAFLAGSADLSHLVYLGTQSSEVVFGNGLYEFVGTGNTAPRRVDLDNAGAPVSACGITETIPGLMPHLRAGSPVSTDGRTIFFTALACGGEPAANEVWARVDGNTSYDASQSQCTRTASDPGGACNAPANATFEAAATDGSRVYFTTTQQLVNSDSNETKDLYEYELPTAADPNPSPALADVSAASSEAKVEEVVRVADDGSRVYFFAEGVLAGNLDARGEPAVPGAHNLYVWERDATHPAGQTKFVAGFESNDVSAQTTPDGRYLVLSTASRLTDTDTDTARDVYRYDSVTGDMIRISTNVSGVGGNAEGFDAGLTDPGEMSRARVAISDSGEQIVFNTAEALSLDDINGGADNYLWTSGRRYYLPTRQGAERAVIDGSGQNVYFATTDPLSPNDADQVKDVYDARVDGGLSFPHAAPCIGETCRPGLSPPPSALGAPSSASLSGGGNLALPVPPKAKAPAEAKALTRAQKLSKALKTCRKAKPKHSRSRCEAQARRRYGNPAKARKGGK
jgi:hypothetical protein